MKTLIYCLIGFLSSGFIQQATASSVLHQTWTSYPFVENAFFEVALKSEFSTQTTPVLKWQSPIKYWIKNDVANVQLRNQLLRKHFQQIRQLTHLSIRQVSARANANMLIFFTKASQWKQVLRSEMGSQTAINSNGSVCMFNIHINSVTSTIHKAVIVIPVDQARAHGKLVSCIVEETTQALGLKNDSEDAYPSIFNDKTPDAFLSPLDIVLLKLLYSSAVKPGMNKASLKPVLEQRYRQLKSSGEIDNALSESVQSPLRLFLGM